MLVEDLMTTLHQVGRVIIQAQVYYHANGELEILICLLGPRPKVEVQPGN
jgi:hypothetical protein